MITSEPDHRVPADWRRILDQQKGPPTILTFEERPAERLSGGQHRKVAGEMKSLGVEPIEAAT